MRNEFRGEDTEATNASDMVRSLTREVAQSQGGTEHASGPLDGSKGNEEPFDLALDERTNCDPQGFQYTDRPRADRYGGQMPESDGMGMMGCCGDMEMESEGNSDGGGDEAGY